jgi:hypothetical protein
LPIFHGRALALDETAAVKEEDVTNKSTKLMWQFHFNNCTFHFVIITVKMMNKMLLIEKNVFYGKHKV